MVNVVVLVGVCGRESSNISVEVVDILLILDVLLLDWGSRGGTFRLRLLECIGAAGASFALAARILAV